MASLPIRLVTKATLIAPGTGICVRLHACEIGVRFHSIAGGSVMGGRIPHIVQYQGSKRILAPQILQYMPKEFARLLEPFSGMAAISIAVASGNRAASFILNDINAPLIKLLEEAIESPQNLINDYSRVWLEQFNHRTDHIQHYYDIREKFNNGARTSANMLYLLARCVKGSVRYGKTGNFNQSPDKRRHGTNPKRLAPNIYEISRLLKGKANFSSTDYHSVLDMARPGDIVYMDPPYQGVSNTRDNRYVAGVSFEEFTEAISSLDRNGIDYIISYDGECGGKEYGEELPKCLRCKKILLNAGRSSQATLLGQSHTTFEALYVSEALLPFYNKSSQQSWLELAI